MASTAAAHGIVTGYTVDSVAYTGCPPYFQVTIAGAVPGNSSASGNPPFPTSTVYPNATASAGTLPMSTGGFSITAVVTTSSTTTVTASAMPVLTPADMPTSTPTSTPVSNPTNPTSPVIITLLEQVPIRDQLDPLAQSLLTWLETVLQDLIKADGGKTKISSIQRRHPRDFAVLKAMYDKED
ncbi:MAG: hypothetical protein MMC33_007579 [Icmadophila ericetorum]|nr:hypothetical protein [Icmadophila ericetorum]